MPAVLGVHVRPSVRSALCLSARWSGRRAVVILAVLLAHLSLMVSPLHIVHAEQVDAALAGAAHATHDDNHVALMRSTVASHEAAAADCGIEWTRTRQQPSDTEPLTLAIYASPGSLPAITSTPAHDALEHPLRRGDVQALLQVYRL